MIGKRLVSRLLDWLFSWLISSDSLIEAFLCLLAGECMVSFEILILGCHKGEKQKEWNGYR